MTTRYKDEANSMKPTECKTNFHFIPPPPPHVLCGLEDRGDGTGYHPIEQLSNFNTSSEGSCRYTTNMKREKCDISTCRMEKLSPTGMMAVKCEEEVFSSPPLSMLYGGVDSGPDTGYDSLVMLGSDQEDAASYNGKTSNYELASTLVAGNEGYLTSTEPNALGQCGPTNYAVIYGNKCVLSAKSNPYQGTQKYSRKFKEVNSNRKGNISWYKKKKRNFETQRYFHIHEQKEEIITPWVSCKKSPFDANSGVPVAAYIDKTPSYSTFSVVPQPHIDSKARQGNLITQGQNKRTEDNITSVLSNDFSFMAKEKLNNTYEKIFAQSSSEVTKSTEEKAEEEMSNENKCRNESLSDDIRKFTNRCFLEIEPEPFEVPINGESRERSISKIESLTSKQSDKGDMTDYKEVMGNDQRDLPGNQDDEEIHESVLSSGDHAIRCMTSMDTDNDASAQETNDTESQGLNSVSPSIHDFPTTNQETEPQLTVANTCVNNITTSQADDKAKEPVSPQISTSIVDHHHFEDEKLRLDTCRKQTRLQQESAKFLGANFDTSLGRTRRKRVHPKKFEGYFNDSFSASTAKKQKRAKLENNNRKGTDNLIKGDNSTNSTTHERIQCVDIEISNLEEIDTSKKQDSEEKASETTSTGEDNGELRIDEDFLMKSMRCTRNRLKSLSSELIPKTTENMAAGVADPVVEIRDNDSSLTNSVDEHTNGNCIRNGLNTSTECIGSVESETKTDNKEGDLSVGTRKCVVILDREVDLMPEIDSAVMETDEQEIKTVDKNKKNVMRNKEDMKPAVRGWKRKFPGKQNTKYTLTRKTHTTQQLDMENNEDKTLDIAVQDENNQKLCRTEASSKKTILTAKKRIALSSHSFDDATSAKVYSNLQGLLPHLVSNIKKKGCSKHKSTASSPPQTAPNQPTKCYFCELLIPFCKMKKHVADKHEFRCSQCCLAFKTKTEKGKHFSKSHVNELFHCLLCDRTLTTIKLFQRHLVGTIHKFSRYIQNKVLTAMRNSPQHFKNQQKQGFMNLMGSSTMKGLPGNDNQAISWPGQDNEVSNPPGWMESEKMMEIEELQQHFIKTTEYVKDRNAVITNYFYQDPEVVQSIRHQELSCQNIRPQTRLPSDARSSLLPESAEYSCFTNLSVMSYHMSASAGICANDISAAPADRGPDYIAADSVDRSSAYIPLTPVGIGSYPSVSSVSQMQQSTMGQSYQSNVSMPLVCDQGQISQSQLSMDRNRGYQDQLDNNVFCTSENMINNSHCDTDVDLGQQNLGWLTKAIEIIESDPNYEIPDFNSGNVNVCSTSELNDSSMSFASASSSNDTSKAGLAERDDMMMAVNGHRECSSSLVQMGKEPDTPVSVGNTQSTGLRQGWNGDNTYISQSQEGCDTGISQGQEGRDTGISQGQEDGDTGISQGQEGDYISLSAYQEGSSTGISQGCKGDDLSISQGHKGEETGLFLGFEDKKQKSNETDLTTGIGNDTEFPQGQVSEDDELVKLEYAKILCDIRNDVLQFREYHE